MINKGNYSDAVITLALRILLSWVFLSNQLGQGGGQGNGRSCGRRRGSLRCSLWVFLWPSPAHPEPRVLKKNKMSSNEAFTRKGKIKNKNKKVMEKNVKNIRNLQPYFFFFLSSFDDCWPGEKCIWMFFLKHNLDIFSQLCSRLKCPRFPSPESWCPQPEEEELGRKLGRTCVKNKREGRSLHQGPH